MAGQILAESSDVFDQDTGVWLGVINRKTGLFQPVSTGDVTALDDVAHQGEAASTAFVRKRGFSSAVDQVMSLFVSEAPNGGRAIQPDIGEGDEIVFGPGTAVMGATFVSSASSGSRFGMKWRGAGPSATTIIASGSAAAFRPDGTTWRMLDLRPADIARQQEWRFESLSFKGMFSPGTDAVRLIDTDFLGKLQMVDINTYLRNPAHRAVNQFGIYLKRAFYAQLRGIVTEAFYVPTAGAAMNGNTVVGYGSIGLCIDECNAAVVFGVQGTGLHSALMFHNDAGAQVYGLMSEHTNVGAIFRAGSNNIRVRGGYRESHKLDNGSAFGLRAQEAIAIFGASTFDNELEISERQSSPRVMHWIDQSRDKSNRVIVSGQRALVSSSGRSLTGTRTLSLATESASTDEPHRFPGTGSFTINWDGNYGRGVNWPTLVDPRCGSVRILMAVKRISGDGQMRPLVNSAGMLGTQTIADGHLLDVYRRNENAVASVPDIDVAASGNSYSASNSGEVTLTFKRPHLLQAGIKTTSLGLGTMTNGTVLYVRRTPSELSAVFGLASGTLADPGAIASGSVVVDVDSWEWIGQPDATKDWLVVDRVVAISFNVVGISLNGSNIPVVQLDRTLGSAGITNGSKLMLWGFADSRLDGVNYDAITGDLSGSSITLTALGPMSDLDVSTAADTGMDTTPVYGKVGFREILPALIGKTNGGAACVWRVTEPIVMPGYSRELITPGSASGGTSTTATVIDGGLPDSTYGGTTAIEGGAP